MTILASIDLYCEKHTEQQVRPLAIEGCQLALKEIAACDSFRVATKDILEKHESALLNMRQTRSDFNQILVGKINQLKVLLLEEKKSIKGIVLTNQPSDENNHHDQMLSSNQVNENTKTYDLTKEKLLIESNLLEQEIRIKKLREKLKKSNNDYLRMKNKRKEERSSQLKSLLNQLNSI